MRCFLHSKLFGIRVTASLVDAYGSLAVGAPILAAAFLEPYEMVLINNQRTGASWQTYVIPHPTLANACEARGGAAHHLKVGDPLVVLAASYEVVYGRRLSRPRILRFNLDNTFTLDPVSLYEEEPSTPANGQHQLGLK